MGPDLIASVANYLKVSGWEQGQQWGQQVALPANLDALTGAQADGLAPAPACKRFTTFGIWRTAADWQALGVRMADGTDLPEDAGAAALIIGDEGQNSGYLVHRNFCSLMSYNPASKYAVAIGLLADAIADPDSAQEI